MRIDMDLVKRDTNDKNRTVQSDRARLALANGNHRARRKCQVGACQECLDRDGEIVPIIDVIVGKSDHKFGHCTFTFFK